MCEINGWNQFEKNSFEVNAVHHISKLSAKKGFAKNSIELTASKMTFSISSDGRRYGKSFASSKQSQSRFCLKTKRKQLN